MKKANLVKIKNVIEQQEYKNLIERVERDLGKIVLLGFGGSYAYGLNTEQSDLDVRGIISSPISNLLGFGEF